MNNLFALVFYFVLLTFSSVNSSRTPTLMISLDGFRADKLDEFLSKNPDSTLQKEFVDVGAKASYMSPAFPSLTFPNHFTIITGLYPETNGIIGNNFFDPDYNAGINFLRDSNSNEVKWWNQSEPLWMTARKQNLKTSSFFWTGSEVWTRNPDIFMKYDSKIEFESRCDEVVSWFKKFNMDFSTLYFNEPDSTGHEHGPDSQEYANKIIEIDKVIGYLIDKLKKAEVLSTMNIVIVSDHGMASMFNKTNNGTIVLKDYINLNLIDSNKTSYGIVSNIFPKDNSNLDEMYQLMQKLPHTKVYKKENIPAELNFKRNNRIAPLVAITDEGYVLNCCSVPNNNLAGNHGFDNAITSMRAIFLARGPDFKKKSKIGPIKTVDVYPLLCDILNIQCNPNNGSITPFLDAKNFAGNQLKFSYFILINIFSIMLFFKL